MHFVTLPLHENFISRYAHCLLSIACLTSYIKGTFSLMTVALIEVLKQALSSSLFFDDNYSEYCEPLIVHNNLYICDFNKFYITF